MTVLIGHAVMDENGGIDGAIAGDQTGKEIATRNWYNRTGGWGAYLEPLDANMADRAAKYMLEICGDAAFGYSQKHRWDGYKSIKANGGVVAGASGDFDCSSLCISCYIFAGLDHKASGYTGSIEKSLVATGKFKAYHDEAHLASADYAKRGGLYVMAGKHVAMVITPGDKAGTSAPAYTDSGTEAGDVARPYVEILGSVRIRTGPGTSYPKMYTAKKGDRLPFHEEDADTGWYWVDGKMGIGCVSGKKALTRLVT